MYRQIKLVFNEIQSENVGIILPFLVYKYYSLVKISFSSPYLSLLPTSFSFAILEACLPPVYQKINGSKYGRKTAMLFQVSVNHQAHKGIPDPVIVSLTLRCLPFFQRNPDLVQGFWTISAPSVCLTHLMTVPSSLPVTVPEWDKSPS